MATITGTPDFSRLTMGELLDFLELYAFNDENYVDLDLENYEVGAAKLYDLIKGVKGAIVPRSVIDLLNATNLKLESDSLYTKKMIHNLNNDELKRFSQALMLDPSDPYIKDRIYRILAIKGLTVKSRKGIFYPIDKFQPFELLQYALSRDTRYYEGGGENPPFYSILFDPHEEKSQKKDLHTDFLTLILMKDMDAIPRNYIAVFRKLSDGNYSIDVNQLLVDPLTGILYIYDMDYNIDSS